LVRPLPFRSELRRWVQKLLPRPLLLRLLPARVKHLRAISCWSGGFSKRRSRGKACRRLGSGRAPGRTKRRYGGLSACDCLSGRPSSGVEHPAPEAEAARASPLAGGTGAGALGGVYLALRGRALQCPDASVNRAGPGRGARRVRRHRALHRFIAGARDSLGFAARARGRPCHSVRGGTRLGAGRCAYRSGVASSARAPPEAQRLVGGEATAGRDTTIRGSTITRCRACGARGRERCGALPWSFAGHGLPLGAWRPAALQARGHKTSLQLRRPGRFA
jgi:hypothetical protein